jgi:heme-degrading monooxygenase HmoA
MYAFVYVDNHRRPASVSALIEILILPTEPDQTERIESLGRELAVDQSEPESRPNGLRSSGLYRAIEDPNRYVLHRAWDNLEDSEQAGRSDSWEQVSAVLRECLASDPETLHFELVDGAAAGTPDLSKVLQFVMLPIKPEKTNTIEEFGRSLVEFRAKPENQASAENGWHSSRLYRGVEDTNLYAIHGTWNAAEDHAKSGGTERGKKTAALIGDCLSGSWIVHHYDFVEGTAVGDGAL